MKRLVMAFIITILIGLALYFIISLLVSEPVTNDSKTSEKEVTYEFDDSYSKEITVSNLETEIQSGDEIVVLIGQKQEDATKKVSSILGHIEGIESLNVYYLEKDDQTNYQNLLDHYPLLSNYLNFTPVILVFRDQTLIGGLPGEVEQKNLTAFFNYTSVL